jgi:16S rRNA (guanine1207-N2)-methyltransferase
MDTLAYPHVTSTSGQWRGDYSKKDVLIRTARIQPGERILDLGWEGRRIVEGGSDWASLFMTSDIREYRRCISECKNDNEGQAILCTSVPSGQEPFDAVLYRPTIWSAKGRVFELIDQAIGKIRIGGRLYLAGRRKNGVESYSRRMAEVFGNCSIVEKEGGLRVYHAQKTEKVRVISSSRQVTRFDYGETDNQLLTFETWPGVFSRDGLDPGSECLLEHVSIAPPDRVLDLGCGCGVLGIVAAQKAHKGKSVLLDTDLLAIECAKENVKRNRVDNADVELSDGLEVLGNEEFDLIISNPPTHEGSGVARQFVEGAARHLAGGGKFTVAVKQSGEYLKQMSRFFGEVTKCADERGYQILTASSPNISEE